MRLSRGGAKTLRGVARAYTICALHTFLQHLFGSKHVIGSTGGYECSQDKPYKSKVNWTTKQCWQQRRHWLDKHAYVLSVSCVAVVGEVIRNCLKCTKGQWPISLGWCIYCSHPERVIADLSKCEWLASPCLLHFNIDWRQHRDQKPIRQIRKPIRQPLYHRALTDTFCEVNLGTVHLTSLNLMHWKCSINLSMQASK